jgi:type II secretion system protein H
MKTTGQEGYSLVELIVVIVIIGLMVAFVMPTFSGRLGGMETEANRIASALRFASEASAAHKHTRAVKFDISAKTMAHDMDGKMEVRKLDSLYSVELLSKGEVTEGEVIIFFSPQGFTEHMSVHLRDKDKALTVQFNPISRKVKIFEPPIDEKEKDEKKGETKKG